MSRNVRIGMVKAYPEKWNVEANWQAFESLVRSHGGEQIDVFISPECFLDGYAVTEDDWTEERFSGIAQAIGESQYIEYVQALAKDLNAYIVFGFTEALDEKFHNCALLVDRGGEIIGKYHKTHLQNHDLRFAPGMGLPVFDLDFGRVGMVICADRRWPESIRTLRVKGAELILNPTYGMCHLDNEWWMRTRSYENETFICFTHPGVALITGPKGEISAKLESNLPDVLVHDIDLGRVTTKMLKDRRPDLYGALADVERPY